MILYCTLLAQAQSSKEKSEIESKMRADPKLSIILRQLRETNDSVDDHRKATQRIPHHDVSYFQFVVFFTIDAIK